LAGSRAKVPAADGANLREMPNLDAAGRDASHTLETEAGRPGGSFAEAQNGGPRLV